jgi:DNA-binding response OmpR family regulator
MAEVQILVVAEHAMIGALLGALVELAGHRPLFAEAREGADAAVDRLRPDLVLLDCEHAASYDDHLYSTCRDVNSRVILFGSSLSASEVERYAARRGVASITLPIGYTAFSQRVRGLLDGRREVSVSRETLRDGASA